MLNETSRNRAPEQTTQWNIPIKLQISHSTKPFGIDDLQFVVFDSGSIDNGVSIWYYNQFQTIIDGIEMGVQYHKKGELDNILKPWYFTCFYMKHNTEWINFPNFDLCSRSRNVCFHMNTSDAVHADYPQLIHPM